MATIDISICTNNPKYRGKTIAQIAADLAKEGGYAYVARYKDKGPGEYDRFALCFDRQMLNDYRKQYDVDVLYPRKKFGIF